MQLSSFLQTELGLSKQLGRAAAGGHCEGYAQRVGSSLQLPPCSRYTLSSCKRSQLPRPAKTSWNKFQELQKAGFMSIRMSLGQEGEVSTELVLPVLTSRHPFSKCCKGCQRT